MIELLDPIAEPGVPAEPYNGHYTPVAGSTIGLLSNSFTDATAFLADIRAELEPALPGVAFRAYDKQHMRNSTYPLAEARLREIAAQCDAVITAYGHCGSCTAATVRDAVAIARAGRAVVALVTERFIDEARFVARAGGLPGIPIVALPHPVAGRDEQFQKALAVEIAPATLTALAGAVVPVT